MWPLICLLLQCGTLGVPLIFGCVLVILELQGVSILFLCFLAVSGISVGELSPQGRMQPLVRTRQHLLFIIDSTETHVT